MLRRIATATRAGVVAATQSERTFLLGVILLGSAISAATIYVLTQWYSVDALSSLLFAPEDCWLDWGVNIGRHCFSDYAMIAAVSTHSNPGDYMMALPPDYQPIPIGTWAPARIPVALFALPAHLLGMPRLGLSCYLIALTLAVISPAVWAARGARGLERLVVFVALSVAAVPAWGVIDRGNSAGFLVPVAMVFFVALTRQRWGLVAVMVILAALLKPQFAVLVLVLFAARQWRWGGAAIAGIVVSNISAFLLWPRGFPGTITQSINYIIKFNNSWGLQDPGNVSFAKALLLIPDSIKGAQAGRVPNDFLAGPRTLIGFVILVIVAVAVLVLGRRIPPIIVGILVLATATLAPSYAAYYYLVFVLPVAALVVRDPNGPPDAGIFDRMAARGDPRRAIGICVSLAAALSIARIALPGPPFSVSIYGQMGAKGVIDHAQLVLTTVMWAPVLWLIACATIIVSYARKPAAESDPDNVSRREIDGDTADAPVSKPAPVSGPTPASATPTQTTSRGSGTLGSDPPSSG